MRLDALDERAAVYIPKADRAIEGARKQVVVYAQQRADVAVVRLLHLLHALALLQIPHPNRLVAAAREEDMA